MTDTRMIGDLTVDEFRELFFPDRSGSFSAGENAAYDGEPLPNTDHDPAFNEATGEYNYVTPVIVNQIMPPERAKYFDGTDAELRRWREVAPNKKFPAPKYMLK